MIFTWIELKRINYGSQDQALINHLGTKLPIVKQKYYKYKKAVLVFHTGEGHLPDGTKASDLSMTNWLSTTINTTKLNTWHLTPRLWAPQELERKIFMVQQLSIFHGTYVVYVSFARGSTYPSRSAVADKILQCFPRRPLEEFWMMFITASPAED